MTTDIMTTMLTDADWVERVSTRMLTLDRTLTGPEVYELAAWLVQRPTWRALRPEEAAQRAFDEAPIGVGYPSSSE